MTWQKRVGIVSHNGGRSCDEFGREGAVGMPVLAFGLGEGESLVRSMCAESKGKARMCPTLPPTPYPALFEDGL